MKHFQLTVEMFHGKHKLTSTPIVSAPDGLAARDKWLKKHPQQKVVGWKLIWEPHPIFITV